MRDILILIVINIISFISLTFLQNELLNMNMILIMNTFLTIYLFYTTKGNIHLRDTFTYNLTLIISTILLILTLDLPIYLLSKYYFNIINIEYYRLFFIMIMIKSLSFKILFEKIAVLEV